MSKKKKSDKKRKKISKKIRWLLLSVAIIFILVIISSGAMFIYGQVYVQKVYYGIKIGDYNLGGKDFAEAMEVIEEPINQADQNGFKFTYQDKEAILYPSVVSSDMQTLYELLDYDIESTINDAYGVGRDKGFWQNLGEQIWTILFGKEIYPSFVLNREELKESLVSNFNEFDTPAVDAELSFSEDHEVVITSEEEGEVLDYDSAINQFTQQAARLNFDPITLVMITDYPEIKQESTDQAVLLAKEVVALAPITLQYAGKSWEATQDELELWLNFVIPAESTKVTVSFNKIAFDDYLNDLAEEDVNVEAKNGKFEMTAEGLTQIQESETGLELNLEQTKQEINQKVIESSQTEVTLMVDILEPDVTPDNIDDMGITDLIGVGESNFAGSPSNRRHNIRLGADTLHGILIEPDEEFSLVKTLGKIEASTGYLPELVIRGNETVPEYGGGLCQIGTTNFRVVLDAGLPITERQPHSYRVSYYEPAGTDATIYDPKPDFKFINDTGSYILFQTRIEGNYLTFEFYGTDDGRQVEMTDPVLSNYKSPGPTKEIETEDLAPGERKCTESAHTGATAEFTQTITYADGEVEEIVWTSVYKPWTAVCLVGKETEAEEPAPEEEIPAEEPSTEPEPEEETPAEEPEPETNTNTNTNTE